ncbi:MAG: FAD-dependent oxidoreductase [Cyanobacteria bacterium P01_H01_bin.21]
MARLPIKLLSGLATLIAGIACGTQPEITQELATVPVQPTILANGRPNLIPLPTAQQVWECEVVVVGGSLGGVAAAHHAMEAGATTCLIELTPWLGGQISSQGVSAIDESLAMRAEQNFSNSWQSFKQQIAQQTVTLPEWTGKGTVSVNDVNACWVGHLCFVPQAGATAAATHLQQMLTQAPNSRWQTETAFKGATFDETGREIVAIHAVQRVPRRQNYVPMGRFSQEIASWYAWSADDQFEKVPLRLEPPVSKQMIVIDATDTGELIGWANLPHRLGSEAKTTTGELNGSEKDNPACTQAFTYPFVVVLHNDSGKSLATLEQMLAEYPPQYGIHEHEKMFEMEGFPFFSGRSFFNYRRIVSTTRNDPFEATPVVGDMTMVNWNRGNDWSWMNPPLIFTAEQLEDSGQQQNWMGGISATALRHGEDHALLFARWLLQTQAQPEFPLSYLFGDEAYMGTRSGLSMVPYIREGRRILGRAAYGADEFMMLEADLRTDQTGGRDFTPTTVAVSHYDIDIHGCRDRNGNPSWEASSAPAKEFVVRPVKIPLESLIPQDVDNLLIGGKSIAASHIVNALTRVHMSEWGIGAAAGVTAGWLTTQPELTTADIVEQGYMPELQEQMQQQGLRLTW